MTKKKKQQKEILFPVCCLSFCAALFVFSVYKLVPGTGLDEEQSDESLSAAKATPLKKCCFLHRKKDDQKEKTAEGNFISGMLFIFLCGTFCFQCL